MFAGGLLATLAVGLPAVLRFQALQDQLDEVRNAWPGQASLLRQDYERLDRQIAAGVDGQRFPIPLAERWRSARNRFDAHVHYDRQVEAAIELQGLLASREFAEALGKLDSSLPQPAVPRDSFEAFQKAQAVYAGINNDWLGGLTRRLFRLRRPMILNLSAEKES